MNTHSLFYYLFSSNLHFHANSCFFREFLLLLFNPIQSPPNKIKKYLINFSLIGCLKNTSVYHFHIFRLFTVSLST